jgi:hypothetical protein
VQLDNRWVVPHNPLLLQLLDCHCNVEAVSCISAVKYLYKYVYKGPDMVRAAVVPVAAAGGGGAAAAPDGAAAARDEVADYLSARYFSAPEACWRMFEFVRAGLCWHCSWHCSWDCSWHCRRCGCCCRCRCRYIQPKPFANPARHFTP